MNDIIKLFFIVLIASILLIPVVGVVNDSIDTTEVTAENWTVDVDNWVELENDDLVDGSVTVNNSTDVEMTEGTDYEINYTDGTIKALSGGDLTDGNTATIDYNYEQPTYVEDGTTRTLIDLVPLFFILVILVTLAMAVANRT